MTAFISFCHSVSSSSMPSNSFVHSSGLIPYAVHSSGTRLPSNGVSCFRSFRDDGRAIGVGAGLVVGLLLVVVGE